MPCSCCHQSGHNIRTCPSVHAKIAEAVAYNMATESAVSMICGVIDGTQFGGVPVSQTIYQMIKIAELCKNAHGWSGMSAYEKQRLVAQTLADRINS